MIKHKQIKEALKGTSDKGQREFIDSLPAAIFEIDMAGNFTFINKTAYKMTGYTRQDFKEGIAAFSLVAIEDQERLKENIFKSAKRKTGPKANEYTAVRKDGSVFPASIYSSPVTSGNKVVGLRGIVIDLTERKKIERQLSESELRYRTLFENAPIGIGFSTEDGHVLKINSSMSVLGGYSEEEAKKMNAIEMYNKPEEREELMRRIKKQGFVRDFEAELKHKNGAIFYAKLTAVPIVLGGDKLLLLAIEDITAWKKIKKELEIKNNAIESSIDAMIMADLNGIITYVNPAFLKLWGYESKTDILGKCSLDCAYFKKDAKKVTKALQKDGSWTGESRAQKRNGSFFDVELNASLVKNENGEPVCILASLADITERKQIDRAKNEFVSLASHQLRTPLTIINWYTETMLEKGASQDSREQEEFLKKIYASSQRLVQLVNAILNVSRIDLGTFAVNPELLDIREIANNVLTELAPKIEAKKLNIKKSYSQNIDKAYFDLSLTQIIFDNIFSNAIKYTKSKGTISLSIRKNKQGFSIIVADNGYGIPEHQQDKIFEKLFRADNVKEIKAEGTGLGLYIVKALVEQSGGQISFKSTLGQGTTFYIRFPLWGMKEKKGSRKIT